MKLFISKLKPLHFPCNDDEPVFVPLPKPSIKEIEPPPKDKETIKNEKIIRNGGITKEEVRKNPIAIKEILLFSQNGPSPKEFPMRKERKKPEFIQKKNPELIYHKLFKLDEGASGKVYLVEKIQTKEKFALKVIKITNQTPLDSIENEISILSACDHPNIVKFVECFQSHEKLWIVMEYMNGGKLTNLLTEYSFKETQTATILKEVLKAVDYLHKNSLIHRDIKSDNILISKEGDIKLSDFGFCCVQRSYIKHKSIVGSPYWMPPEVIKGLEYNEKADIWSIGILLLEIVEGEPPYLELNPVKALYCITSYDPPKLKDPKKWSSELNDILSLCLQKDPNQRASTKDLLNHPFIQKACRTSFIVNSFK